ncbi:MAG: DUF1800 family protein [Blastocatellia bacterium]|nr:DUF1800 family protein [Blastocatellia bacterium]
MVFKRGRGSRSVLCACIILLTMGSAFVVSSRRASVGAQGALAVVSAASYGSGALAAEQIVAGFGSALATGTAIATTLPLPTSLSGTSVKVKDAGGTERLAPLFFVSPTQINFQIPVGTGAGSATITVVRNNANAAVGTFTIAAVAPALFTADASGKGIPAANLLRLTAAGEQKYERVGQFDPQQNKFVPLPIDLGPASDQVYLILYGTGFRNRRDLSAVRVTIGGVNAETQFAGPQGVFAGLDQLNVRIPREVPGGEMDVVMSIDGASSNPVRIAVTPPPRAEAMYLAGLRPEGSAMSPASGYATMLLSADEKTALIRFTYANLTTPETSAHIHGPADPGQDGQILFDLDTAPRQADGSFVWAFTNIGATTVPQIVQALKSGRLYINIHSSRYPAGEIRGHFGVINGSQNFTPPAPPPALPGGPPTARDAARFLTQATFGPKAAEIPALQAKGFDAWLNEQFAKPVNTHIAYLDVATAGKKITDLFQLEMMESFWKSAVTGDDQLRQRVTFALSQILVVSFNSNLSGEEYGVAGYMDVLQRNAFGNFRTLLEEVTLNPAMGRYLDMLQNDKEDPVTGRNPNENYAREILQLFSIGLYKLHPDGSLKLDANGLPIPTYDQEVIKGFASAFTGWSYGWFPATEQNWLYPKAYDNGTQFWRVPMQAWPNHHSQLAKTLLDGVTLPANRTAQQDLTSAIDNIFNHPNVGPFIARQLIQRMVTSNPSPGYIYRVTQKFNNNGSGVRGDMKAVIRAILTDYEARSLSVIGDQGFGKMREPIIRFAHLLRGFNYTCPCGTYPVYWMDSPEYALAQNPLRAPTVFNFYEPAYSHPGHLASAGLHSPEFQITNETSVIGISTFLHYVVRDGFKWEETKPLTPNYAAFNAIAGNVPQLIDQLDLMLTAGGMSQTLRGSLLAEIAKIPSAEPQNRVTTAVHLIMTSPDYVIQK